MIENITVSTGGAVLSKCANPDCSASFRYFRQGRLFRVDTLTGLDRHRAMDGEPGKSIRRLEFFWLCDACAMKMTLICDRQSGVTVQTKTYELCPAQQGS